MRIWLIFLCVEGLRGAPFISTAANYTTNQPAENQRQAFILAEKDAVREPAPIRPVVGKAPSKNRFLSQSPDDFKRFSADTDAGTLFQMMETVVKHPMMTKVWSFIENFTGSAITGPPAGPVIAPMEDEMPQIVHKAEGVSTSKMRRLSAQNRFLRDDVKKSETSFRQDSPIKVIKQSDPTSTSTGKITDEVWSKTLFGERGVLTEIFHSLDEQRRAAEANSNRGTLNENEKNDDSSHQSDSTGKIGSGNFDLKKIFDSIFTASQTGGQFGDPAPELPEFLGICNRLSCGDIYKAIDQFRKSEFFSNFQTALQLIQDPKGWEIIGKALENPELISEFAGNSGLKEMFGSALGGGGEGGDKEKTKANQRKKTEILPEDGDFGTDFTEIVDGLKPKNKSQKPEISFSIDGEKNGSGGDYYSQLSKSTDDDEDVDHVDVEIQPPKGAVIEPIDKPIPPSKQIEKSDGDTLPDLSFSEDGDGEVVVEKSIDVAPPKKLIDVRISPSSTTTKPLQQRVIRLSPSTPKPIKTTKSTTKWTPPPTTIPTTTKRNYRKDNDYYAMYYDH